MASTTRTSWNCPTARSVRHLDDAVDLGRLAGAAGDARLVDEHGERRADGGVAAGGGDVVLHLAQLGEPLVHQARVHRTVEAHRVGAVLGL